MKRIGTYGVLVLATIILLLTFRHSQPVPAFVSKWYGPNHWEPLGTMTTDAKKAGVVTFEFFVDPGTNLSKFDTDLATNNVPIIKCDNLCLGAFGIADLVVNPLAGTINGLALPENKMLEVAVLASEAPGSYTYWFFWDGKNVWRREYVFELNTGN